MPADNIAALALTAAAALYLLNRLRPRRRACQSCGPAAIAGRSGQVADSEMLPTLPRPPEDRRRDASIESASGPPEP